MSFHFISFHFISFHFISFHSSPSVTPPLNNGLFLHVFLDTSSSFAVQVRIGGEATKKLPSLDGTSYLPLVDSPIYLPIYYLPWVAYSMIMAHINLQGCSGYVGNQNLKPLLANSQIALLPQTVHLSQGCHHGILLTGTSHDPRINCQSP